MNELVLDIAYWVMVIGLALTFAVVMTAFIIDAIGDSYNEWVYGGKDEHDPHN